MDPSRLMDDSTPDPPDQPPTDPIGTRPSRVATAADPHSETRSVVAPPPSPPGYKLLRHLGEGGMGEVYEAEQTEPVHRRVAFKVIKRGMDSQRILARFEAERQALALMDHPGIARIFDGGMTPDGRPFFSMEMVRGVPITQYCDDHRLGTRERLELFVQVCQAVQHAHQKGVIHRDLKPSNILVTIQDGKPTPKVIDFGLAKTLVQPLTERTLVTDIGQVVGTIEYMSPEQADLTGLDVDTRTDVYALGVVLYVLLAGTLPFDSRELREAGYDEARRRIREDEPKKPSTRVTSSADRDRAAELRRRSSATDLARRLQGDLDWIVMMAIDKDRNRRYETVNALAVDIRRHLAHQPVFAAAPSRVYQLRKFARRHRVGVAGSAVAATVVVAFAATTAFQAAQIATERDRANREAETAAEVSSFLVDLFEVVDPEDGRGNTVTAREVLDAGTAQLQSRLDDRPLVRARLMDTVGGVYLSLGLSDDAEPLIEEALTIRQDTLGDEHPETAASLTRASLLHEARGEHETEEVLARQALEIRETTAEPGSPEIAAALRRVGWALFQQGRYEEAEELFDRAFEINLANDGEKSTSVAESYLDLGSVLYRLGRYDEAEAHLTAALAIDEPLFGTRHGRVRRELNVLGLVAQGRGDLEASEAILRRALGAIEEVFGSDDRRVASACNNLAVIVGSRGRFAEAQALFERAEAIYRETIGIGHQEYAMCLGNLAWAHASQGQLEEAEALYERSIATYTNAIGRDHPSVATVLYDYAVMLLETDQPVRARQLADESALIRRETLGADHPNVAQSLVLGSDARLAAGDRDQVESGWRKGLSIQREVYGDDHPTTVATAAKLAEWLEAEGRAAEAASVRSLVTGPS